VLRLRLRDYEIDNVPRQVSGDTWQNVALGPSYTRGVQSDRTLWCWERPWKAGASATDEIPVRIGNEATWSIVSTGLDYTCALQEDESLWCRDHRSGELEQVY
jgi:hypothetical protein